VKYTFFSAHFLSEIGRLKEAGELFLQAVNRSPNDFDLLIKQTEQQMNYTKYFSYLRVFAALKRRSKSLGDLLTA
jgi:hypothetical protein